MKHRITLTFVVAGLASGCGLASAGLPAPTGPSELSLSLSLEAAPDLLVQDGASSSRITVTARDAHGRAVSGLSLFVDVAGDDVAVDVGRLSHRKVTTDLAGVTGLIYIAPRATAGKMAEARTVRVAFTTIGHDHADAVSRSVLIRLVPPSAIS